MYYTRARSSSTTNRYIYRGNCYAESIYSTRPSSGEKDTPDTRLYIRNKGPLKGQAYKLKDPSPLGS